MFASTKIVRQQWSKLIACCIVAALLLGAVVTPSGLLLSHGAFSGTSLEHLVVLKPDSTTHADDAHVHSKHGADHGHDTAIAQSIIAVFSSQQTHTMASDLINSHQKPSGERMERPPRA